MRPSLGISVLLFVACGVDAGPLLTTRTSAPRAPRVAWGAFAPRTAADLASLAALGSTTPSLTPSFDGFVLEPAVGAPWARTPVDVSAALALGPGLAAPAFAAMKEHLLATRIAPGDVDDDDEAGFSFVVDNFASLARVAAAIGARGLMLDTQTYERQVFSFAEVGRGRALSDVQRSMRRRGDAIMRAMLAQAPTLVVVVTMGYAEVWRSVCADGTPLANERYGLLPAFLDGMREALGEARRSQLVDGFLPAYATRTPQAFPFLRSAIAFDEPTLRARSAAGAISYRYPRVMGAASEFAWKVPSPLACPIEVRAQLERVMPVGFGVMIDFKSDPFDASPPFAHNFHTPDGFFAVLDTASRNADALVWLFSAQVDWWSRRGNPPLPPEYRDALDRAR